MINIKKHFKIYNSNDKYFHGLQNFFPSPSVVQRTRLDLSITSRIANRSFETYQRGQTTYCRLHCSNILFMCNQCSSRKTANIMRHEGDIIVPPALCIQVHTETRLERITYGDHVSLMLFIGLLHRSSNFQCHYYANENFCWYISKFNFIRTYNNSFY